MALLETLVFGKGRSIAGIVPDVTISETCRDEVIVTEHPVDYGASVSDHAYVRPSVIEASFGWSDSSRAINSVLDGSIFKGLATTQDIYAKFLQLMGEREPFEISTGKRAYPSVVITRIECVTNGDTENSLVLSVTFTEVRYATAKQVSIKPASKDKGGTQNLGTKKSLNWGER